MTVVPRRRVLTGSAGLPLAAVLADPRPAAAAAAGLDEIPLTTPSGGTVKAALAVPETTPAPSVLLIHEWWGLNDQVKAVAAEFANPTGDNYSRPAAERAWTRTLEFLERHLS